MIKLSNKKQSEEDTYTVLFTRRTEVYARNNESGQVLRRHQSKFIREWRNKHSLQLRWIRQIKEYQMTTLSHGLLSITHSLHSLSTWNQAPDNWRNRGRILKTSPDAYASTEERKKDLSTQIKFEQPGQKQLNQEIQSLNSKQYQRRWSKTIELWKQPSRC